MPRLFECRCGAIGEEIGGVRYDWFLRSMDMYTNSYVRPGRWLHPVHLTVIPGGRG